MKTFQKYHIGKCFSFLNCLPTLLTLLLHFVKVFDNNLNVNVGPLTNMLSCKSNLRLKIMIVHVLSTFFWGCLFKTLSKLMNLLIQQRWERERERPRHNKGAFSFVYSFNLLHLTQHSPSTLFNMPKYLFSSVHWWLLKKVDATKVWLEANVQKQHTRERFEKEHVRNKKFDC